jgi:hypothetical protein
MEILKMETYKERINDINKKLKKQIKEKASLRKQNRIIVLEFILRK